MSVRRNNTHPPVLEIVFVLSEVLRLGEGGEGLPAA